MRAWDLGLGTWVAMACPICVSPEGAAITAGMRAGAGVLILVSGVVIALIARFAWRLWRLDSAPHKGVPYDSPSPEAAEP